MACEGAEPNVSGRTLKPLEVRQSVDSRVEGQAASERHNLIAPACRAEGDPFLTKESIKISTLIEHH
jgi:hypothetical protein